MWLVCTAMVVSWSGCSEPDLTIGTLSGTELEPDNREPEDENNQEYCVSVINSYREEHGLSPLIPSETLNDCASNCAEEDALSGEDHGCFNRTGGCDGQALVQNELLGFELALFGSVQDVISVGMEIKMSEGVDELWYQTILGAYTEVGCGVFLTESGDVWVVQVFA